MPTPHHLKNLAVPANRYTLREAAAEGLLVSLRCTKCRRAPVLFLARDLMQVLDPERDCLHPPPFPCSKSGGPSCWATAHVEHEDIPHAAQFRARRRRSPQVRLSERGESWTGALKPRTSLVDG